MGVGLQFDGLVIDEQGKDNLIKIDQDCRFVRSKIIIKGNNNSIRISSALLYTHLIINLKGNDKEILIKESNKNINNLKITSIRGDGQIVNIGSNFSCGGIEVQMNDGCENFTIGDNCLFSWGIKARTSDGHSVVDLDTNRAVNLPQDIVIEDKVWVGEDVSFLKGSKISKNSVVGSRAVVTKKFNDSNVVIAGFPAKVVKKGITWDRRMPSLYNGLNND